MFNTIVFCLIAGLMLFNYGFQLLRIPPSGFGVPISEIVLGIYLLRLNLLTVLGMLKRVVPVQFFLLWVAYSLIRIGMGCYEHGIVAVRDGSPVIESLFVLVGFVYAKDKRRLEWLLQWFAWIGLIALIYILLYPFRSSLWAISPQISSTQGRYLPMLFNFDNTSLLCLVGAAICGERYLQQKDMKKIIYVCVLVVLPLLLAPSRTLILAVLFFVLYFSFRAGIGGFLRIIILVLFLWLVFLTVVGMDLDVKARFGHTLSADEYFTLFKEIFVGRDPKRMISSGNEVRFIWWASIFHRVFSSWDSSFFGLGYGIPLMTFSIARNVLAREPHNEIVSVLGRGGLVGLIPFLLMQFYFVRQVFRFVQWQHNDERMRSLSAGFFFLVVCTLIATIGENPFIMSYYAVPYYFISGVVLRYSYARTM